MPLWQAHQISRRSLRYCTVQYRSDLREVWCACHNGIYDLNGRNVSGPPPRPLDVFDVHLRGDEIVVNRKREA